MFWLWEQIQFFLPVYFISLLLFCRGAEASCNPPILRRNASSSSNISDLASQTNPTNSGNLKKLSTKINDYYCWFFIYMFTLCWRFIFKYRPNHEMLQILIVSFQTIDSLVQLFFNESLLGIVWHKNFNDAIARKLFKIFHFF